MYSVEAQIVVCHPSDTYLPSESIEPDWISISDIPQLETDLAELREARVVAAKLRWYYHHVRITEGPPGGERRIVL